MLTPKGGVPERRDTVNECDTLEEGSTAGKALKSDDRRSSSGSSQEARLMLKIPDSRPSLVISSCSAES